MRPRGRSCRPRRWCSARRRTRSPIPGRGAAGRPFDRRPGCPGRSDTRPSVILSAELDPKSAGRRVGEPGDAGRLRQTLARASRPVRRRGACRRAVSISRRRLPARPAPPEPASFCLRSYAGRPRPAGRRPPRACRQTPDRPRRRSRSAPAEAAPAAVEPRPRQSEREGVSKNIVDRPGGRRETRSRAQTRPKIGHAVGPEDQEGEGAYPPRSVGSRTPGPTLAASPLQKKQASGGPAASRRGNGDRDFPTTPTTLPGKDGARGALGVRTGNPATDWDRSRSLRQNCRSPPGRYNRIAPDLRPRSGR